MAESARDKNQRRDSYTLELVGIQPGAERPSVAVQAFGAKNEVLHSQRIGADGKFSIPAETLKNAHVIAFGAPEGDGISAEGAVRFHASEFELVAASGTLALAEGIWSGFHFHWHCVSGSVRVCRRRPIWFDALVTAAIEPLRSTLVRRSSGASLALHPSISDISGVARALSAGLSGHDRRLSAHVLLLAHRHRRRSEDPGAHPRSRDHRGRPAAAAEGADSAAAARSVHDPCLQGRWAQRDGAERSG